MKKSIRYLAAGLVLVMALFMVGCAEDIGTELPGNWVGQLSATETMTIEVGPRVNYGLPGIVYYNIYPATVKYFVDGALTYTWVIPGAADEASAEAAVKKIRARVEEGSVELPEDPVFSFLNAIFDVNLVLGYGAGDGITVPPMILYGTYESGAGMHLEVMMGDPSDTANFKDFPDVLFEDVVL